MNKNKRIKIVFILTSLIITTLCLGLYLGYRQYYWHRYTDFGKLHYSSKIDIGLTSPRHLVVEKSESSIYILEKALPWKGAIQVVNTLDQKIETKIELSEGFPVDIKMTPDGRYVLVSLSSYRGGKDGGTKGYNCLAIIDTKLNQIVEKVDLPWRSASGITVSPNSERAFVTDRTGNKVFQVNLNTKTLEKMIKVPEGPYAGAFKPKTDLLYIVSTRSGQKSKVSVLNIVSSNILDTIQIDLKRCHSESRAVFSPDGNRLLVVNAVDSRLAVIDTNTESEKYHQQIALIDSPGKGAFGLAVNPTGTLALVLKDDMGVFVLDVNTESSRCYTCIDKVDILGSPLRFLINENKSSSPTMIVLDRENPTIQILDTGARSSSEVKKERVE